jgi:phosphohistidine phosphatase
MLLRHGKSDWHAGAGGDFGRPLARRGEEASMRIGSWLLDHDLLPEYIIKRQTISARLPVFQQAY